MTATCSMGLCGFACRGGHSLDATGTVCAVNAMRQIAPLSTATVTTRRLTLRWLLSGAYTGAHVEICRERTCATVVTAFDAAGSSGAPTVDLPAGVAYWRMAGPVGMSMGTGWSRTWEFTVGARSAPLNSSWGTAADFNGDGCADVVVGAPSVANRTGRVCVFAGSVTGTVTIPAMTLTGPDGSGGHFGAAMASAGDVNGDGFADLVVGAYGAAQSAGRAYVYLGSEVGLGSAPVAVLSGMAGSVAHFGTSVASAGDVDGDGSCGRDRRLARERPCVCIP